MRTGSGVWCLGWVGICALASGCAAPLVQEDWDATPAVPSLPMVHVIVAESELPGLCGHYSRLRLYGCARRDYRARSCTVYTGPQPHPRLVAHERRHCEGWDHAPAEGRSSQTRTAVAIGDPGGQ